MIRMKSYFQRVIAMGIMKYMREKLSQVNRCDFILIRIMERGGETLCWNFDMIRSY